MPSRKGKIIGLLCVVVVAYLVLHFIGYGSLTRNCSYTEEELTVPAELVGATFITTQPAYRASSVEPEYGCMQTMGHIPQELVAPETINNISVGRHYYTDKGRTVSDVPVGTTFTLVHVISVVKHGITTMDSGGGPLEHLLLADSAGNVYSIATVELGTNPSDRFIHLVTKDKDVLLDSHSFDVKDGRLIFNPNGWGDPQ